MQLIIDLDVVDSDRRNDLRPQWQQKSPIETASGRPTAYFNVKDSA